MPNLKVSGSSIMDMGLEQSSGLQTPSQLTKPMLHYTFLYDRPAPSAVLAPLPLTPPSRPTSPRHHVTGSPRGVQSADRRAPRVRLRRSRPSRPRAAAAEPAAGTGPPCSDGIVNKMLHTPHQKCGPYTFFNRAHMTLQKTNKQRKSPLIHKNHNHARNELNVFTASPIVRLYWPDIVSQIGKDSASSSLSYPAWVRCVPSGRNHPRQSLVRQWRPADFLVNCRPRGMSWTPAGR